MITEQVKPICAPDYKQEAHHQRMDLASRLRQSLEQSGMTASHLARAAGVVPQTIGKLLDGSNKNFSCPSVFAIAAALNVSPEWLATGRGQKDRRPQTQEHQLDPFVAAILADLAKTRTPDERQTLERYLLSKSSEWLLERHDKTRPPPANPAPKAQASS